MTSEVTDENSSARFNMVNSPEMRLSFGTSDGGSREGGGLLDLRLPPEVTVQHPPMGKASMLLAFFLGYLIMKSIVTM